MFSAFSLILFLGFIPVWSVDSDDEAVLVVVGKSRVVVPILPKTMLTTPLSIGVCWVNGPVMGLSNANHHLKPFSTSQKFRFQILCVLEEILSPY